jgi:hypothetical protein
MTISQVIIAEECNRSEVSSRLNAYIPPNSAKILESLSPGSFENIVLINRTNLVWPASMNATQLSRIAAILFQLGIKYVHTEECKPELAYQAKACTPNLPIHYSKIYATFG